MSAIVLVHGAHVGSWCWDLVAPQLQDRGHRVEAVELHRGSLPADTAVTQEVVDRLDGPVVVCGWSYGGMVITGLRLPRGSQLAYVCALMPDEGETASSLIEPHPTGFGELVALDDAGDLVVAGEGIDEFMWEDAPADRAAEARASLCSQAIGPLVEPPVGVAWRTTPSTYVVGQHDRVVHPELQRTMAQRAGQVVEWETSHSPMLSRPELVVGLLDRLATGG